MTFRIRKIIRVLVGVGLLATACAHAPPANGNRAPNAPIDPDNPEQNCSINNTIDCRPGPY